MRLIFQIQDRITPEMLGTISRLAAFEMHIIRQVSVIWIKIMIMTSHYDLMINLIDIEN